MAICSSMKRGAVALSIAVTLASSHLAAAPAVTLREAARLTTARSGSPRSGMLAQEQLPAEPRKETGPERKHGFFRSPGGVVILVVAGALVVGAAARSILDNDDGRTVD